MRLIVLASFLLQVEYGRMRFVVFGALDDTALRPRGLRVRRARIQRVSFALLRLRLGLLSMHRKVRWRRRQEEEKWRATLVGRLLRMSCKCSRMRCLIGLLVSPTYAAGQFVHLMM